MVVEADQEQAVSKRTGKLSVKGIDRLTDKGRYGDGRGLYLQIVPGANGLIRSWLFRFKRSGREKTMGFGPLDDVSLDQARELASQQRGLLRQGIDPVMHRDDIRAKHRATSTDTAKTFSEVVDLFHFLISLAQVLGMSADDVFEAYLKKNAVNLQRQESGYRVKDETDSQHI